jgi:hypothetical protein
MKKLSEHWLCDPVQAGDVVAAIFQRIARWLERSTKEN